jgi:hypothetical protein
LIKASDKIKRFDSCSINSSWLLIQRANQKNMHAFRGASKTTPPARIDVHASGMD